MSLNENAIDQTTKNLYTLGATNRCKNHTAMKGRLKCRIERQIKCQIISQIEHQIKRLQYQNAKI